jgi:hypothetical protein
VLPQEISDILPANSGFLRTYLTYACECSDAPPEYHLGVGLTVFAGAMAERLQCPWLAGRTLVPNMYTILIGPSRSTRKTASMDAGIDILQGVEIDRVMPIPGSYEELIAQIRRKSHGLLTYREFGHFLKITSKGYAEPLRTVLMDLYDWPPERPYVRNLKKGTTVIDPPICLSLLAAIATDLLYAYVDLEDWTGGFFGRMTLLYAERNEFKMPATWRTGQAYLTEQLAGYLKWSVPPCGGFTAEAWAAFTIWSRWRDGEASKVPARVQTFVSGATTLAAKIALLFAADCGEPLAGAGWLVSIDTLYKAVQFVEKLYLPSVIYLGEKLAIGIWERDRQRVLDIIERSMRGITRRDLLKRAKVSSEYLDTVLGTLREEGTVVQGQDSRGVVYRVVRPGETAPIIELNTRRRRGEPIEENRE